MTAPRQYLGLTSGIGLVAGSMIGTGVFVSAGFMAQDLSAGWILVAWLVGAAIASAGAITYGELVRLIPRSGGEYRFLFELLHPGAGYLAGWGSLIFGFSAPLAINALGAALFLDTLLPLGHPRLVAALFILVPTLAHAFHTGTSRWFQDALVAAKVVLVVGFAVFGLALGETSWPSWSPPRSDGFAIGAFMTGLFFVGFAFSGWNSAVYAASEFRDPRRDVPRSMVLGLALVTVLYLIANWVFVANLSPAEAAAVEGDDKAVTLGHLIARSLLGDAGGSIMSGVIVLAFLSAISAITVIGPRVYAEMASDGLVPRALGYRAGRPPVGSVLFQGAVAIALLVSHSLRQVLFNASAILLLFTALAAASLVRLAVSGALIERFGRPRPLSLAAATVYTGASAWMLYHGFRDQPTLLVWLALIAILACASFVALRAPRSRTG